ncbi:integrase, catalytic region, zinc finger, CCHC-type containing protein, partial [Tanacetum coccineum]
MVLLWTLLRLRLSLNGRDRRQSPKLEAFWGLRGIIEDFAKGFSLLALPLTKLMRKGEKFVWNKEREKSIGCRQKDKNKDKADKTEHETRKEQDTKAEGIYILNGPTPGIKGKANVVANALSRNNSEITACLKIQPKIKDLELMEVELCVSGFESYTLKIEPNLILRIKKAQKQDGELWSMLENLKELSRDSTVPKLQTAEDLQGDALLHYDAEIEVMNLIQLSIPNDIYNSVDACILAKDMWKRVERLMRGTIQNQVDRETRFTNEFDQFAARPREALISVYNRFAQLMNDLERNNMHFPIVTINTKFLNSLQPEWLKYVTQVRLAKRLTVDTFDDLFDYLQQFEKLVNASRAKKLEKSHDPLALVAHTGSSSRNTSSYYVTHPTSVVDYDDEYQQDDVQTNSEDPLASAMLLLARAITQNFSNPTNNRLRTSSNTRNQAIIQGDRVNIQSRNSGNTGRNTRRAYVQEEVVEGSNAQNETGNVQRTLRTSSSGNTSTVQCYNCSGKGHYARNCPKPRVRDSKYFMEQMLLAKQDEAGVILTDEHNDFLFADASRMEEIEELSANICLMARIQPANNTSDAGPSYDSAFISEVQSSLIEGLGLEDLDAPEVLDPSLHHYIRRGNHTEKSNLGVGVVTVSVRKTLMLGIVPSSQEFVNSKILSWKTNVAMQNRDEAWSDDQIDRQNQSSVNENKEQMYPIHTKMINSTIGDDQIDSNIIFDKPNGNVNSGSVEKDTHVPNLYTLEQLARNAYKEAEKQRLIAQKVQQQNTTLTSQLELYKERVWVLENINGDNNYLNEFLEADRKAKHFNQQAQSQFVRDRDIIRDLEKERDKLDFAVNDYKWKNEELQKTHLILKRQMSENEDRMFMLGPKPLSVYDPQLKLGLGYPNPYTLKQAISQCPKLYIASSLSNSEIPLNARDTEDTLDDASKSQQKMKEKMNDPIVVANKQNCWTINYKQINAIYKDFVPQKVLSAEQKYFPSSFIPFDKTPNATSSISASMPSESPLIIQLDKIKNCFQTLSELIQKNCKRASIFYTSPEEIQLNDFFQDQVKPIVNELQFYFELFRKLFQRDIKEMKDVFESTESELCEIKKQNDFLKDQLLEASFKHEVEISVLLNHECEDNSLHAELEQVKKNSIEIQEGLQTKIKILEKDVQRCQKQSVDFDLKLQHAKEKHKWESNLKNKNTNPLDYSWISKMKKLENENVSLDFKVQSLMKERDNTLPDKQRGPNSNNNVITPRMYKVVTTQESQTNEAKSGLSSIGMNAASSVRRPMNRDSHVKNSVLANSKNSAKKVTVYVRKNKQTDNTFANVISNKENVNDVS